MSVECGAAPLPGVLAGLKREGSSLLVVGDSTGQRALCERLAGSEQLTRDRIIVETSGDQQCRCESMATDSVTRVEVPTAVTVAAGDDPALQARLSEIASRVVTEIDALADAVGPGDLRVCLGPVDPLFAVSEPDRVALFLDAVLERVRREAGMVHVHVTAPRDSENVARLTLLFDAVLESRADPVIQHRWHLPERDTTTNWLPVED